MKKTMPSQRLGYEWFAWGSVISLLDLIFMKVYYPSIELTTETIAGVGLSFSIIGTFAMDIGCILILLRAMMLIRGRMKK